MQNKFMELVEQASMKTTVPKFEIGDTVDVHVRILEGEKERVQIFNGVVIARSGVKTREMFVVRRIADIVVKRSGKVRRAKLYYLRDLSGKAVRLKERFPSSLGTAAEIQAAKAQRRAARSERKVAKAERAKAINEARNNPAPPAAEAAEKPAE